MNEQHTTKHKKLKGALIGLSIASFVVFIAGLLIFFTVIRTTPPLTKGDLSSTNTTKIYDKNKNVIYTTGYQNRNYVKYKDIPENYKNALISTEDNTFWKNSGVNFKSTFLGFLGAVTGGRITSRGGSTITQQLVKLSVFSTKAQDRTIKRKIQEIWLSLQIKRIYSKQQILEYYVNKIYEGNNIYGAQTISNYYYGKDLDKLSLSQSAVIAGLGQSPTSYNLYTNKKIVQQRRDQVLLAMYNNGKLTKQQVREAKKEPVDKDLVSQQDVSQVYSKKMLANQAFIQSTLDEAKSLGYDVNKYAYKIYTSYDQDVQNKLNDTLNNSPQFASMPDIQAAGTIVNPNNGQVVAQSGGRNVTTLFGLNRATQQTRSSGSSIKPLIDYGPGIENFNWATNKIFDDTKYVYPGTNIVLHDFDMQYMGPISMRVALEQSRNVPAVRALDMVGSDKAKDFLTKLGITTKKSYGGSDAIGIDTSTAKMARAYAAIDNGGTFYKNAYISSIVDATGKETRYDNDSQRAMKQSTAFILTSMMEGVFSKGATAYEANIGKIPQAGKTGTVGYAKEVAGFPSDAVSDSWMVGFTKADKQTNSGYVVSIWTGYDSPNEPNHYIPAVNELVAVKVYREMMNKIYQGQTNGQWTMPSTVRLISGDANNPQTGTFALKTRDLPMPDTSTSVSQADTLENYYKQNSDNKKVDNVKVE